NLKLVLSPSFHPLVNQESDPTLISEGPIEFSTALLHHDEALQGKQVPAFLSKTLDLIHDSPLYPIISWGSTDLSFVVWDPTLFARRVLPRNFKHNNFSSFVRHSLKVNFQIMDFYFVNATPNKLVVRPCTEAGKAGLEFEIEKLRRGVC
ncbi:Heat stress transcription factor A-3, partial [Mucuna pruriens]